MAPQDQLRPEETPGAAARRLVRGADRAALATRDAAGWPHASLVLAAADHDASPILLLSDLALHSRNIAADERIALLFDGTAGAADPLAAPRVTVQGRAARSDDARLRARFLARHADASDYAGFADFHLYRLTVERAQFVAGFGRIHRLAAPDLLYDCGGTADLAERESGILEHMNADHAEAVRLYAEALLGLPGGAWRMIGIDPEGIDLRLGRRVARLSFAEQVRDPASARRALMRLADAARQAAGHGREGNTP